MFEENDLVIVVDDPNKIVYKINKITDTLVELKGYKSRTKMVTSLDSLSKAPKELVDKCNQLDNKYKNAFKKTRLKSKKYLYGRILHIDGDKEYLDSCLNLYKEIGIFSEGLYMSEKEVYKEIEKIMLLITPDIIVITGHDAFTGKDKTKIDDYENTKYFIKTIRKVRKHFSFDEVIIVAGACESHFEALIASGANFASSPKRINTHTYDPAVVAIKAATTSTNKTIDFENILKYIENGRDALGGIETKGKMRLLL